MNERDISFTLNGQAVSAAAEPRAHLADFIREELLLTGTHIGCEQGVCGACTVFVDGRPTRSCITLAASCEGADVRTVEGFDNDPLMKRIREAFSIHHGLQCGYCTPGMLTTAYDIARRLPDADTTRIRRELAGNLCRCTGYAGIVAAIEDVLSKGAPAAELLPMSRSTPAGSAFKTRQDKEPSAPAPNNGRTTGAEEGLEAISLDDATKLTRSLSLAVSGQEAWAVLSDPERVITCVPGASLSSAAEAGALVGQILVAVGPIKATFQGRGSVTFDVENKSGRLVGRGRDTVSRTGLEGSLAFTLHEDGSGACRLDLDMRYRLAGPLSQFGRPELVAEIADRLLQQVGAAIEREARGEPAPSGDGAPASLNGLALLGHAIKAMVRRMFGGS
jgi:carbon-monoxide dehydrogenase small subunit